MSLHVRPTGLTDLDFVLALEAPLREAGWIAGSARDEHVAWIESPDVEHWIVEQQGAPIGLLIFRGFTAPNRSIELKRIAIAGSGQGKGLGREALRWAKHHVFVTRGMHRLWLDAYADNLRAQRLYRSEGFRDEGVLRDAALTERGWVSLVLMSMLDHEYAAEIEQNAGRNAG